MKYDVVRQWKCSNGYITISNDEYNSINCIPNNNFIFNDFFDKYLKKIMKGYDIIN
jgi:hypothetical protein